MTSQLVALICLAGCDGVFGLSEVKPIDPIEPDAALPVFGPFSVPVRVDVPTPNGSVTSDVALTADEQQMIYTISPATIRIQIANRGSGPTHWVDPFTPDFAQPAHGNPAFSPRGDLVLVTDHAVGNIVTWERVGPTWQETAYFAGLNTPNPDRPGTPTEDLSRIVVYRAYSGYGDMHELELTDTGWVDVSVRTLGEIRFVQPAPAWTKINPRLTPDGLTLVYVAGPQQRDLYLATRPHVAAPFAPPVKLDVASDPELYEGDPWLSPDGRRLYFSRYGVQARAMEFGIYFSERMLE